MSQSYNVASVRYLTEDLSKCQSGNELLRVIDAWIANNN